MARHRSLRIRRNHGLQFPRHDRGRHRVRRRRRHFQPSLRRPLRHPRPTRGVEVTVASATDSELGVDATPWTLLRGKASHLREILRPFIRVLRANPLTLIGFILVVIISTTALLVAIVPVISQVVLGHPVLLTPYDPNGISTDYSQAPSLKHLLGTDKLGLDIFSRVLAALPLDLAIGVGIAGFALLLGGGLGLVAGYWDKPRTLGGVISAVILRVTDVFLAFPSLVLALAIAASLGRGTGPSILAVLLTWWPYYVRLTRGEVLAVKHRPYVVAARAAGVSEVRILFRQDRKSTRLNSSYPSLSRMPSSA